MRIIWSNDNYHHIDKPFGSSLCGITYKNKRPDYIIVQNKEILELLENCNYYHFVEYLIKEFLTNNITLEIRHE